MASVSVAFTARSVGGGRVQNGARRNVEGAEEVIGDIVLTGSYTSTKIPLTASDFTLDALYDVQPGPIYGEGVTGTGTFYSAYYDHDNGYILAGSGSAELAADSVLTSFTFPVRALGREA